MDIILPKDNVQNKNKVHCSIYVLYASIPVLSRVESMLGQLYINFFNFSKLVTNTTLLVDILH